VRLEVGAEHPLHDGGVVPVNQPPGGDEDDERGDAEHACRH
jgi:hypothetical protein